MTGPMDRLSPETIDRELGRWLRDESAMRAPARLVEGVFARTARTRQARRWWPSGARSRLRVVSPTEDAAHDRRIGSSFRLRGRDDRAGSTRVAGTWGARLAPLGGIVVVLLAVVVGFTLGHPATGPASNPGGGVPLPTASVGASAAPSIEASVAVPGKRIDLGDSAGPIGVIDAFGSIWIAEIHGNEVRRFDPETMAEVATVPVPSAAWFAVADGALWVTNQTGTGLSRIDPATNRVVAHVGDVAPCGAPVVAFGSLWQATCDAGVVLRIDPTANKVIDTIPAGGYGLVVLAADRLVAIGPEGLASLDPSTRAFTPIPNRAAFGAEFFVSDGTTVWVENPAGVARIDPANGQSIAGFPFSDAGEVSFAGDHAWLTVASQGVLEIDLATNQVTRTIPVGPSPLVAIEAGGALWVTDFDDNALWRIDL